MPANQGAPSPVQKALVVQTLIAAPQPLSADIEVPGTIMANETAEIHPEVSGRLVQLNIKEGTNVSVGALLAKLYDLSLIHISEPTRPY